MYMLEQKKTHTKNRIAVTEIQSFTISYNQNSKLFAVRHAGNL